MDTTSFRYLRQNLREALGIAMEERCSAFAPRASSSERIACNTYSDEHNVISLEPGSDPEYPTLVISQVSHTDEELRFAPAQGDNYHLAVKKIHSGWGCQGDTPTNGHVYATVPVARPDTSQGGFGNLHAPGKHLLKATFHTQGARCVPQDGCFDLVDPDGKPLAHAGAVLHCPDTGETLISTSAPSGRVDFAKLPGYAALQSCKAAVAEFTAPGTFTTRFRFDSGNLNTLAICEGWQVPELSDCDAPKIPLLHLPSDALVDTALPRANIWARDAIEGNPVRVVITPGEIPDGAELHLEVTNLDHPEAIALTHSIALDAHQDAHRFIVNIGDGSLPPGKYALAYHLEIEGQLQRGDVLGASAGTFHITDGSTQGICTTAPSAPQPNTGTPIDLIYLGTEEQQTLAADMVEGAELSLCNTLPFQAYCAAGLIRTQHTEPTTEQIRLDIWSNRLQDAKDDPACPQGERVFIAPWTPNTRDDLVYIGAYGIAHSDRESTGYVYADKAECLAWDISARKCASISSMSLGLHELAGHAIGELPDVGGCQAGDNECGGHGQSHIHDHLHGYFLGTHASVRNPRTSYHSLRFDAAQDLIYQRGMVGWMLKSVTRSEVIDDATHNGPWAQDALLTTDWTHNHIFTQDVPYAGAYQAFNIFAMADVMSYDHMADLEARITTWREEHGDDAALSIFHPLHTREVCKALHSKTGVSLGICEDM